MSDVLPHTGHDLPADAVEVLRCFAALDIPDLSVELVSAAADLPFAQVEGVVDELLRSGLLTPQSLDHQWYRLAPSGVVRLAVTLQSSTDDTARRTRFVDYLLDAVVAVTSALRIPEHSEGPPSNVRSETTESAATSSSVGFDSPSDATEWVIQHRTPLLAAVAMGSTDVAPEATDRLAAVLWPVTAVIAEIRADRLWRADLSRHGEEAAIRGRRPRALIELLQASAHVAAQETDYPSAEAQWVRAVALWRDLDDPVGLTAAMTAQGEMYRSWGRWNRALDVDFGLVSEYQQRHDDYGVARALHQLGLTMLRAGRPDSAVDYLAQAQKAFAELAQPALTDRAQALVDQGRAYWRQGMTGRAQRCFSAALALWVDVDDHAAERARRLLSTPAGRPLPDDS